MKHLIGIVLGLIAFTQTQPASAQSADLTGTLIVLNKGANSARFIALDSSDSLATLPTGTNPQELVVTSDGRFAVAANFRGGDSLTVFDIRNQSVARTIDLGDHPAPHGILLLPGEASVIVTTEDSNETLIGPLGRILLPEQLNSTRELRTAAAQLRGDVLLLYTFDTSFRTDMLRIGPLQAVSLGFFPNKKTQVTTTCAAAFVDVRTGYVYGVAEASASEEQRSNAWDTQAAIEKARVTAERDAFAAAIVEIEKLWGNVRGLLAGGEG